MDTQNQLAKWMQFFDQNGLGTGNYYNGLPVYGVNNNANRVNWALARVKEDNAFHPQEMPNFFPPTDFGPARRPTQGPKYSEYTAPQFGSHENPYSNLTWRNALRMG